ncbi:MAG: hypothetical protein J6M55_05390 [Paludibacteraceae bacterium]|nr:hypothetical protein [Paludibacteraceae bacterium]
MKLKEIREAYEGGTASANAINRQLIFSGIAIIWILKAGPETSIQGIPDLLLCALILLASSLAVDILQSLVHVVIWYCCYAHNKRENLKKSAYGNGLDEEKIVVPEQEWWSIPTWILWGMKIALTIVAYAKIIMHLWRQL